jgi:prepilin-type N-terminal cleavage/methylation domain-containing protein
MEKREKRLSNQSGFSLMEVMIAITIFTVFATVFVTGEGYNLLDSAKLKEEMKLKDLCENKINEIITSPPELRDSLTITKEVKDFENDSNYQYSIEYKKFVLPDMTKLKNSSEEEADPKQSQMEKKVYTTFKENMEKILWQVEVVVRNKTTEDKFRLSTWLYNNNADIKIGSF